MQHSRPPLSGRTQLYGLIADPVAHLQAPAALNALFDRRGVDAVCVPLHVTAEHFTATVAGMRHLGNFAGYGVSMPPKAMAARLCDELLPNARACGVVNIIRVDPDGQWIGESLDGVGMVKALMAQRALDATTRVAGRRWGRGAGDWRRARPRGDRRAGHHQSDPGQGRRPGPEGAAGRPCL